MDVNIGGVWGSGKMSCMLIWMTIKWVDGHGDTLLADSFHLVCTHSNGHGCWRSMQGTDIQEMEKVDQNKEK